jgi:8-oxo-dGTP pyrophosphatase MutT (NUDIX family)
MRAGAKKPAKFIKLSHLHRLRETEQVAAVCYRVRRGEIEFLLVRTRGHRWIFPKGGVEPGLSHAQAAALEAFEEAGVHGRMAETAFSRYALDGRTQKRGSKGRVHAHLCEVRRLVPPQESGRERTWFSAGKAKERLREGRSAEDGKALSRVVDRAVIRIHELSRPPAAMQPPTLAAAGRTDDLQKVQFETPLAAGAGERVAALFTRYIRIEASGPAAAMTSMPRLSAGNARAISGQKVVAIDRG